MGNISQLPTGFKLDPVVQPQGLPQGFQLDEPEEPTLGEQVLGGLQTAGTLASGIVAEPLAGLAGIGAQIGEAVGLADPGAATRTIEATREALTFQGGEESQRQLKAIGETLEPVAEKLGQAEDFLGDTAFELTGSPAIAAAAKSLPTAALEILGFKGSKQLTKIRGPSNKLIKKTLVESAPDIEKIKNTSRAVFDELDKSGVLVKQPALKRLQRNLERIAKKEGIRERVTPRTFGAIEEIKGDIAKGQSLSTVDMDELRTVARNAVNPADANEARVAMAVVDEVDSFLDGIKSADIEKGAQVSASDVGKKYRAARKLWGRAKRAEMLQDAIEIGSGRKAGVEKGIRNELNNLLNRKKSRKFLTPEDVKAIRKVTDGDFKQNFASLVGGMGLKFENSPSLFSSIIGGGGAGAIASTIPGLGGAVAPVAIGAITIGTISKQIAKKITINRAKFLQTITGAGNDAEKITRAYLRSVPKNKRRVSDLSDLLLDPDVDLNALENIANETVKDAVKAAQFKREILQAGAVLGAGSIGSTSENSEGNNEG